MDPLMLAAVVAGSGLVATGPVGLIVLGVIAGVAIVGLAVAGGVFFYLDYKEKKQLAQGRAALAQERAQQEAELANRRAQQEAEAASQSAALEQEAQKVKAAKKATEEKEHKVQEEKREAQEEKRKAEEKERKVEAREAIINQKLIKLAVEKIRTAEKLLGQMKEDDFPPEKIRSRMKKLFPELLLEDDLRDPKTGTLLLDDCVRAPDGYYYNRSTLVEIYKQAQDEKKEPVCFKDPSISLPDPTILPNDPRDPKTNDLLIDCVKAPDGYYYNRSTLAEIYEEAQKAGRKPVCFKNELIELPDPATLPAEVSQARIQILRRVGSREALSLYSSESPASVSKTPVAKNPLINSILMPAQEDASQKRTFLEAPNFYTFFTPEQKPDSAQPSLTGDSVDVALVMKRGAEYRQGQVKS